MTNSKESIITNLITLSNNIVLSIDFNEKYYNNENGYFIKIEYKIFNIAHMILEIGQDIEFLVLNDEMIILKFYFQLYFTI